MYIFQFGIILHVNAKLRIRFQGSALCQNMAKRHPNNEGPLKIATQTRSCPDLLVQPNESAANL